MSGRDECSGACRYESAGAPLSGAGTSRPQPRSQSGISAAKAARCRSHVQGGLWRSWAVAAQFEEDAAAVLVAALTPPVGEQADDIQAPAVLRQLLAVSGGRKGLRALVANFDPRTPWAAEHGDLERAPRSRAAVPQGVRAP